MQLKEQVKKWSVEKIVEYVFLEGQLTAYADKTQKDTNETKRILINELNRRLRSK